MIYCLDFCVLCYIVQIENSVKSLQEDRMRKFEGHNVVDAVPYINKQKEKSYPSQLDIFEKSLRFVMKISLAYATLAAILAVLVAWPEPSCLIQADKHNYSYMACYWNVPLIAFVVGLAAWFMSYLLLTAYIESLNQED